MRLPKWCRGKESACQCRRLKRYRFNPWVRKIPEGGNSSGFQDSCLENFIREIMKPGGLQSMGHKSQTRLSEQTHTHTHTHTHNSITNWVPAAAAAKSLQSCLTLCDPIDSSPSGSSVPRILQGRILEWVAISFSKHACMPVASVVSDSVQPHGQQSTRLLCAQDSLGKNTGVGRHFLLQLGG